jgi:hypothetical protein
MVAVFDQVNAITTIGPLFCADAPQNFSLLYSNEVQTVKTDSYNSTLFGLMVGFYEKARARMGPSGSILMLARHCRQGGKILDIQVSQPMMV